MPSERSAGYMQGKSCVSQLIDADIDCFLVLLLLRQKHGFFFQHHLGMKQRYDFIAIKHGASFEERHEFLPELQNILIGLSSENVPAFFIRSDRRVDVLCVQASEFSMYLSNLDLLFKAEVLQVFDAAANPAPLFDFL